jgi:hypothetical protein
MSKEAIRGPRYYAEDGEWYDTWLEAREVTRRVRESNALSAQARAILFPKEFAAETRVRRFEELDCCLRLLQDLLFLHPLDNVVSKDVDEVIAFVGEVREAENGSD